MDAFVLSATRNQKVDFVHKNILFTINGRKKRAPKKDITNFSDDKLDKLCDKYSEAFKNFIENPPVKLKKFFADCETADGDAMGYDGEYPTEEDFRKALVENNIRVLRIVPARGNHRCMYCDGIAEGPDKKALCEECREMFGHYSYDEL